MAEFEQYLAQVKEWERIYGKPEKGPFRWSPDEIRASCVKCGKIKKKMSRHHICSDYLFALLRPDLYARRYIEFRKEDCAKLCDQCHKAVERYYDPIQARMLHEYTVKGCTQEWCEAWRKSFREAFELFLKPKKKRKRGRARRKLRSP